MDHESPAAPAPPLGRTVSDWDDFRRHWGGVYNFLLGGEVAGGFDYPVPPLERIVEGVRAAPKSQVRGGIKGDAFDLSDIKAEFCRLPLAEALRSRFVLAYFRLHPALTGPGQVFEGLEERGVEPWRRRLRAQGFTFHSVYPILFASGGPTAPPTSTWT